MDKNAKISIASHRGLVGSAILRNLLAAVGKFFEYMDYGRPKDNAGGTTI